MPLLELEFAPAGGELPARVAALLSEAEERISRFSGVPGFVHSDFVEVYRALRALEARGLAPGEQFCEWGSGFGVVACIAAQLGYRAAGIEIEASLVDEARALAAEFDLDVEFAHGTFVPEGGEAHADETGDFAWFLAGGACGNDALGLDPAELDVVFAYPWPGEERAIEGLFEQFAADGALLVTSHGLEGVRARRKA